MGNFEARVTPIADTDPATLNSGVDINKDASASFTPGEYDFLAVAPGYGFVRFSADIGSNQVKTMQGGHAHELGLRRGRCHGHR